MSENNSNQVSADMDDIEIAPKVRVRSGLGEKIAVFIAVSMSLFHIYTAFFGIFESVLQRSAHLGFAIILTFIIYKPYRKDKGQSISWYDYLFILLSLFSFGYLIYFAPEISQRMSYVDPLSNLDIFVGVTSIILLVEATRRTVGKSLMIIMIIFLAYAMFGENLPGLLAHRKFTIDWIVEQLYFTTNGVLGIPLGVSATFIFIFILFGKFLEVSGAGQFFIDLAVSGMGKYRGGPAKTAIVASSILGTISGSAVANTVTTGSFTIPLMKKTGYKPEFAASVEAVSSSGGQIMPPIMGASAFIIASYLGVPYIEVAIAAIIPALLFYLSIFFQVDFRARRRGLEGLPKEKLPNIKNVLKEGFLFFTPLVVIVYLLTSGLSPMRAGLFAIISVLLVVSLKTVISSGVSKTSGQLVRGVRLIFNTLNFGARGALETAIATAAAGLIIGLLSLTGLGLRFSSLILTFSGGNLLLTLIFTMISSIILGMGLPTVAAYIVQVALTVPALIELGVPALSAHMFIFYFAIVSAITPPVALAAFAGAGIAGSDPMKTGMVAFKLGIAAFVVPYMFIYGPSILMVGDPIHIFITLITASVGIYGLAAGTEGWIKRHMHWWERVIIIASALTLIKPGLITDTVGFLGIGLIYYIQYRSTLKGKDSKLSEIEASS